jgi:uncharacterized protein
MPNRDQAPIGAPCWADLWTSDVEGSRTFYSRLFGWEAQAPDPGFGGYFQFTLGGAPVAGGMGPMPDAPANNSWKIYLATGDIAKTVAAAEAEGAQIVVLPIPVADLGIQTVLVDPAGATVGAWQPGTFPGFAVVNEPGAPSWFELHTRGYGPAVAFYQAVFGWETDVVADSDEFRYTTVRNSDGDGDGEVAGIMDSSGLLTPDAASRWWVYWGVEDMDDTVARVETLGGSMIMAPEDTRYGRLATAADPSGGQFKLHTPNA